MKFAWKNQVLMKGYHLGICFWEARRKLGGIGTLGSIGYPSMSRWCGSDSAVGSGLHCGWGFEKSLMVEARIDGAVSILTSPERSL